MSKARQSSRIQKRKLSLVTIVYGGFLLLTNNDNSVSSFPLFVPKQCRHPLSSNGDASQIKNVFGAVESRRSLSSSFRNDDVFDNEGYLGAGSSSSVGSGGASSMLTSQQNQEGTNAPDAATDDDGCDVQEERFIMLISDATGVMGKSALQKCLTQFEFCDNQVYTIGGGQLQSSGCTIRTKLYTFIRTEERMAELIKLAQETNAMIIFTLANPEMREKTMKMCELSKVLHVDLMGNMFGTMSTFFGQAPRGSMEQDGEKRRKRPIMLSDNYFRRIDAVEFTLKADDGQSPWLLEDADVILVGVSRTGKTPLSVLLSQTLNLRVANVPLVLEVPPPKELLNNDKIDPKRVICLTISPGALGKIRSSRLKTANVRSVEKQQQQQSKNNVAPTISNYADRSHMVKELMNARRLSDRQGWTEFDVTGKAIEETASRIAEILKSRFPDLDFI